MALSRINGPDELYVGGIFALRRPSAMEERGVTHILSMIRYDFVHWDEGFRSRYVHLSIDVDDVEDEDVLVHLPRAVRFIDGALHPRDEAAPPPGGAGGAAAKRPAVFVHCAMGKSRSVTAAVAYLLWKYPHSYGLDPAGPARPGAEAAREAVRQALRWVRETRDMAEPNPGFMRQLEMWVRMGTPAGSDDAVEKDATYQRWAWEREVKASASLGRAPEWIRFEDEAAAPEGRGGEAGDGAAGGQGGTELRCKKCRRVLATQRFVVPHRPAGGGGGGGATAAPCPHFFVEALSWMRPTLEEGALDGRLACPNARCGASVGRYSWQGFRCSCGEWVCPAFSLQRARVDEVAARGRPAGGGADPRAALGIRMPPGAGAGPAGKENL